MAPATTLPASWFQSTPLYQLERRAIFLNAWHFVGPITRFVNRGEKVYYEIAQVKFYVVNRSPEDTGWGANGIEVHRDNDDGSIHVHFTSSGLVFITLSSDSLAFEEFFPDLEPLLSRVDFTKLKYRRSISYEGCFNWKTMIDGYQECLHCQYAHPSFSKLYPPTFYSIQNHGNFCRHIADPKKPEDGLFLYFFPICTLNVYGGGMSSFRTCPTPDPTISRMEFDYYYNGEDEAFEEYFKFVRQVALEDYELCVAAQQNLQRGVYVEGVLNPEKESGVIYYQQLVRNLVLERYKAEKAEAEEEAVKGSISHVSAINQAPSGLSAPTTVGVGA
ncbi:hypothetical protein B9Z19DRAFT_1118876 [Tuber borchii]|uniref:Choline monooxygenase, chloroplastic n=1 Tax=Tuber borchii TaxID=42251 RepID=A0A2T7A7M4_TUBBO|nr:hypothetical protein B9Z19DRAFT_1118876 [Tuber borchii]